MQITYDVVNTPLGPFTIAATRWGICMAGFDLPTELLKKCLTKRYRQIQLRRDAASLAEATRQLKEYLKGKNRTFDLILDVQGTPFQRRIWEELKRIPYGQTISYSELAERSGRPVAMRAGAGACGSNPVGIFVPCHRVIGKDGSLTGYASGVERKAWLLKLEEKYEVQQQKAKKGLLVA